MIPKKAGTFTVNQANPGMNAGSSGVKDDIVPVTGVFASHTDGSLWTMTMDSTFASFARGTTFVLVALLDEPKLKTMEASY